MQLISRGSIKPGCLKSFSTLNKLLKQFKSNITILAF